MPPPPPLPPWFQRFHCAAGEEHSSPEAPCVQCSPGKYGRLNNMLNLRSCAPCDAGNLQPLRGQMGCVPCPDDMSVVCGAQDKIDVVAGYYRPDGAALNESLLQRRWSLAVPCPWGDAACLGGNTSGDASCRDGHWGPFCAMCRSEEEPRYYRGSSSCLECPTDAGHAVVVTIALGLVAVALLVMMAIYLDSATAHAAGGAGAMPSFALASCFPGLARCAAARTARTVRVAMRHISRSR